MQSLVNILLGSLFGIGLLVSDINNTLIIKKGLDFLQDWNFSLFIILIVASLSMWTTLYLGEKIILDRYTISLKTGFKPICRNNLIAGSIVFGIGWGAIGLCPGPAILNLSYGTWEVILFLSFLIIGLALNKTIGRFSNILKNNNLNDL